MTGQVRTGRGHYTGYTTEFSAGVQATAVGSGQADSLHGQQGEKAGKRGQDRMLAGKTVFVGYRQSNWLVVH